MDVLPTSGERPWKILSNCVVVMVADDNGSKRETAVVVVRGQRGTEWAREGREGDALRSLNTRSTARAPPSPARPRHPSASLRRRPRPGLVLGPYLSPSDAMDSYNPTRMSWGPGFLSPLSPTTIESLESRSRDVQERTFCKWCVYTSSAVLMTCPRYHVPG